MASQSHILRPETILFVGAGATAALSMPTTVQQAEFLWKICDVDNLSAGEIEKITGKDGCFYNQGQNISDFLAVLDGGVDNEDNDCLKNDLKQRAFPGVNDSSVARLVRNLRRHYDLAALKLVAKAKKGESSEPKPRAEFLQEVFTLIDACLREQRGFTVYDVKKEIFLTTERLRAAREALILIINTMFACAWKNLMEVDGKQRIVEKYRGFFFALAKLMQREGRRFIDAGLRPNYPEFYQFSYSLVTTNFEPLFLWFIWQSHREVNKGDEFRVGSPGRQLRLMMNFPNALGMSRLADADDDENEEELNRIVWTPCTDAAAQGVNNPKQGGDRFYRFGKYFPVHGMSVTRHCPMCGRLNLYMGDSWDENSSTLFTNGVINAFNWGQVARTDSERDCFANGEYDALECHFCGKITHSYDNFMFMQTQLKSVAPSFIKEATDEALAGIAGAKHIVLLGYSMPLDDAIWGSLFTAMSRRPTGERLFCTVVDYIDKVKESWVSGDQLDGFYEKSQAIRNAVVVFGKENVRAYVKGVPNVFGTGSEDDVKKLLYPHDQLGWDIKEFSSEGVIRCRSK